MTEAQRNYLADLAGRKNARLRHTDGMSADAASAKITELEQLPDAVFREITQAEVAYIQKIVDKTREELHLWTFTR